MGFGGCSFYPPNPRPKKLVTFMEDVVSSTAAANLTSRPHGGGSETPMERAGATQGVILAGRSIKTRSFVGPHESESFNGLATGSPCQAEWSGTKKSWPVGPWQLGCCLLTRGFRVRMIEMMLPMFT